MRELPDPGFAGDTGAADPAVRAALAAYDADPATTYLPTLAVLQDSRVLVPVVAMIGEMEEPVEGELPREKTSEMAAVLTTGADGRRALLAFTGSDSLQEWNPRARPVPVSLVDAARAACQEEAEAVVLDLAGPHVFVIEDADLRALAAGHRLLRVEPGWGWGDVRSTPGQDVP